MMECRAFFLIDFFPVLVLTKSKFIFIVHLHKYKPVKLGRFEIRKRMTMGEGYTVKIANTREEIERIRHYSDQVYRLDGVKVHG
ncbi:MAG: hypothetical protein KJ668_18550, partial [Proteobacteria bacterium]|nr:hypothetical protein [Pseudomonadota bacterium]